MICPNSFEEICEAFLDETMEYNDLPGLVVGVAMGDRTFVGARGVRDVVTKDPLQADDIFHCASVSKLFTSAAIMKLVDAGVLALDDRLCDILPEFSERWMHVRLWQMLSHTAGIGDVDDYHWEEALTSDDALSAYVHSDEVMGQPLLWEPGEGGFRYSNIAYEILGHIVSVKSADYIRRSDPAAAQELTVNAQEQCDPAAAQELTYEDFVQRFLLEPAGMTASTMLTFQRFGLHAADHCPLITDEIRSRNAAHGSGTVHRAAPNVPAKAGGPSVPVAPASSIPWHPMALPHEKTPDRSIAPVRYYPYTRSHAPSSTLTSNAADLLKWARLYLAEFAAPLPPLQIRREYAEVPNNHEKMGLGWFMRRQGGYQLYGHEGTDDGFRASFWICPARELGIVVLSNLSGAPVKKLGRKLFERLTG